MPAKFIRTYKYTAPDGQQFDTLAEEQHHELSLVFGDVDWQNQKPSSMDLAKMIVEKRSEILPILSQRERKHVSPAKPRKRKASQPVAA